MTRNSLENHTMHGDLHLHILTNQFSYWAQTKRLFKHREHACPECGFHTVTRHGLYIHRRLFH
jgi:hypothetical protein